MMQHILLHRQKINFVHLTAYSLHSSTREHSHKLLLLLRKKKSFIFNFPALRSECNLRIFWYLITFLHGSSGDYWNLRKYDERMTTFFFPMCWESTSESSWWKCTKLIHSERMYWPLCSDSNLPVADNWNSAGGRSSARFHYDIPQRWVTGTSCTEWQACLYCSSIELHAHI